MTARIDLVRVTLGVRAGHRPSAQPPVRIFLGTEDGQFRAERVFVYAIERVRDPARTYEIHLMKNLGGFRRRGWRTGFTNYRFAIPELAGRAGRAIYNDVDQVYLADPAALFDADIKDHGYLSISPGDTSVLLLDCARMHGWWNVDAARREDKDELTARAARVPGLWGALDERWNARDMEYTPGHTKLLHFTALHLQPWQPFPEQYAYHEHPLAFVWLSLERAADAEGYQVFTRDAPSPRFAAAVTRVPADAAVGRSPARAVDFMRRAGARTVAHDALALVADGLRQPVDRVDGLIALDLGCVPSEDRAWVLVELFHRAGRAVYVGVHLRAEDEPLRRAAPRWRAQLSAVAAQHPDIAWRLDVTGRGSLGLPSTLAFERLAATDAPTPTVWALLGHRAGDNRQVLALAAALGWPVERKQLVYNRRYKWRNVLLGASLLSVDTRASSALAAPWPDLVIASGRRSVPVARWIRKRSGGRTRLVHIGRPWAPLALFDLVITTPQYRLPARQNVLHNTLPLGAPDPARLEADARHWAPRFAHLPRPLVAVLVGGDSRPYRLDAATAARLGCEASALARSLGGALLVTCGPRLRSEAAEALFAAVSVPAHLHRWSETNDENPYLAYLALASRFVVTADSASMLAEACGTGKPVTLFELPEQPDRRWRLTHRVGGWIERRQSRPSARGTPKQQDWLGRIWDRLIDLGLVTLTRDLGRYHAVLEAAGLAARSGRTPALRAPIPDGLAEAVRRVTLLMREARPR